jgi:hypothetical protein
MSSIPAVLMLQALYHTNPTIQRHFSTWHIFTPLFGCWENVRETGGPKKTLIWRPDNYFKIKNSNRLTTEPNIVVSVEIFLFFAWKPKNIKGMHSSVFSATKKKRRNNQHDEQRLVQKWLRRSTWARVRFLSSFSMNLPPTSRCNTSLRRLPSNLQSSSKLWNEISSAMSSVVSAIASQTDWASEREIIVRAFACEEWEAEEVERERVRERGGICVCVYECVRKVRECGASAAWGTDKWRWRRE